MVFNEGEKLATLGGSLDTLVEFTWDTDEIYIAYLGEDDEVTHPDYNLAHEDFNLNKPEESLELGLQSWSEVLEEDDDWDDDDDDDFDFDYNDEFDGDWDAEEEEEWVPREEEVEE